MRDFFATALAGLLLLGALALVLIVEALPTILIVLGALWLFGLI